MSPASQRIEGRIDSGVSPPLTTFDQTKMKELPETKKGELKDRQPTPGRCPVS